MRVYHHTVTDIRANWVPRGRTFVLAHVGVEDWSPATVVRFGQLRGEKATGQIVFIDRDRLLK